MNRHAKYILSSNGPEKICTYACSNKGVVEDTEEFHKCEFECSIKFDDLVAEYGFKKPEEGEEGEAGEEAEAGEDDIHDIIMDGDFPKTMRGTGEFEIVDDEHIGIRDSVKRF